MKTTAREFSVVIPVRDRAAIVTRTLDSIAAQSVLPAELIVVDNGSTDDSATTVTEWMKRHADLPCRMTLLSEPRPGAAAARNCGLRAVTTRWVIHFDSDDLMLAAHIARIEDFSLRLPEVDLIYFDRALRDDDGWTQVKGTTDSDLLRAQLLDCPLSTQSFAVRTDLLRRVGGWDEELPRWNDYELGVRLLLEAEHPRKLAGEPTVVVLPSDDSITGADFSHSADDLERALDRVSLALRKAGKLHHLKYVYARRAVLAGLYAREGDELHSRRLADTLTAPNVPGGSRTALVLSLIQLATRLTGHGGSALARMLLREKKPKQKKGL